MKRSLNRRVVLVLICCASGILLFINVFNSSINNINVIKDASVSNRTFNQNINNEKLPEESESLFFVTVTDASNEANLPQNLSFVKPLPWYFSDGSIPPAKSSNNTRNAFQAIVPRELNKSIIILESHLLKI